MQSLQRTCTVLVRKKCLSLIGQVQSLPVETHRTMKPATETAVIALIKGRKEHAQVLVKDKRLSLTGQVHSLSVYMPSSMKPATEALHVVLAGLKL